MPEQWNAKGKDWEVQWTGEPPYLTGTTKVVDEVLDYLAERREESPEYMHVGGNVTTLPRVSSEFATTWALGQLYDDIEWSGTFTKYGALEEGDIP